MANIRESESERGGHQGRFDHQRGGRGADPGQAGAGGGGRAHAHSRGHGYRSGCGGGPAVRGRGGHRSRGLTRRADLADTYAAYPHLGPILPALGYYEEQLRDLEATIAAVPADLVVSATPFSLRSLMTGGQADSAGRVRACREGRAPSVRLRALVPAKTGAERLSQPVGTGFGFHAGGVPASRKQRARRRRPTWPSRYPICRMRRAHWPHF